MFIPGGAIVVAGIKIGIGALAAVGIGLASSLLLKPSRPKQLNHATERLQATLDPHAPRKAVFGHTAMATDVRYQAYTGTDQEYCEQILCVASHTVESIDELWFDSKKAWSAAGGVTAGYTGYLTVTTRNPGTAANGIAIDSVWTANCTLTGCAYLHIKYKLTGNTKKAESPFASGIPSRVTVRGKGIKVPDIRVVGVDPDDQTTWVWSSAGSDSGRNPALQRLAYLIGWRINGKLAVGRGIPSARLDLDSFIDAANICDETVSLVAGGTEKRYISDCVVSEGDDPSAVLGAINAAMNAVPTDDGGRLGVFVLHNDLSDPDILELSDDDLAEPAEESWKPTPSLEDLINVVRGRFTDSSDAGLYQMVDAPEVTLAGPDLGSPDGIQRIDTFDLPAVQSGTQWQRLAHLRLNRTQFPGIYTANFKARGWAARMWKPVRFTHRGLRFTDKLFRVVGQELPMAGAVQLVLREESADIYGAGSEVAVTAPAVPTPWDYVNDPLLGGIDDASGTANWSGVLDDNGERPEANATLGAPSGTLIGGTLAQTVEAYATDPADRINNHTTVLEATKMQYEPGVLVSDKEPAEADADVTADHTPDLQIPGSIDIAADSTGATTTPLPLTFRTKAFEGAVDKSPDTAFALGTLPAGITASINNTASSADRGVVTITAANSGGNIPVTATIPGHAPITKQVPVNRTLAPATSSGGSGATSASDSSWANVSSATHASITDTGMIVRSKSDGTLRFSAAAEFVPSGSTASHNVAIKARYSLDGSTWSDFAAEAVGGPSSYDADFDIMVPGGVSISETTKSGLAASTDYYVDLQGRRTSGTATVVFSNANFTVRQ